MYNSVVFISRFDELRRKKSYEENRNLPLRVVAEESGLSLGTIQRVKAGHMDRIYLSTLEALCGYFNVKSVSELIDFVPGNK